jgi:hypothetical protein
MTRVRAQCLQDSGVADFAELGRALCANRASAIAAIDLSNNPLSKESVIALVMCFVDVCACVDDRARTGCRIALTTVWS